MIKLVIFDLDGTILYTLDSIALSANKVLKKHSLKPLPVEDFKMYVGDGVIDLLIRSFKAAGSSKKVDESTIKEFRACFKDDCDYKVAPYKGIPEIISFLKKNNVLLACNTNKPHENAQKLIKKHFADNFDMVLGQREGVPKKPDKSGAEEIINTFNLRKDEVIYVGDSDVDIFTAKNCGIASCGAAWGYRGAEELKNSGADFVINSPKELIKIINCKFKN